MTRSHTTPIPDIIPAIPCIKFLIPTLLQVSSNIRSHCISIGIAADDRDEAPVGTHQVDDTAVIHGVVGPK
jgi:hypothetical protein